MDGRHLLSSALLQPPLIFASQNLKHIAFRYSLFSTTKQQEHNFGLKAEFLKSSMQRASASLRSNSEEAQVPTSVPVRVAYDLLLAGHKYLDVRTPEEFSSGHAPGAINVPYMYKVGSGMTKNSNFFNEVSAKFGKDDEIIVGCQIGKRSMMAATDLIASLRDEEGFEGITDIAGGFSAWTQNDLPIER